MTWCWALLILAGCAAGPHRNTIHAPHWANSALTPAPVPPAPVLAEPALGIPERRVATNGSAPGNGRPVAGPAQNGSAGATVGNGGRPAPFDPAFLDYGAKWIPLQRWSRTTGLATLSQLTSGGLPTYALHAALGVLVLHPGTLLAQWDGLEVRLGFAPQLIDEQPYVHALDLQKTILPLLNGKPSQAFREPVVIDAGHGGEDAGANGLVNGYKEKDLTLDWALRLQRLLAAKGLNVLLSRSNDANLTPSDRVALAAGVHAGLFISLHFNSAAPDQNEAGLETYCLTPAGMPSSLTRGYGEEIGQAYPNNDFDAQNLQFAVQIHRALLQVNGHQDRGVRRARFPAVLRGQQCPAVLIEGGYLSNPAEARLIADAGYRQRLADAVARAVEACVTRGRL